MPLSTKNFIGFTDLSGQTHLLPANHPVSQAVSVTIVCDGPHCAKIQAAKAPVTYSWDEDTAVQDPAKLIPDGVFRVISAQFSRTGEPLTFCSRRCLSDYLRDVYIMPLSPREQAEIEQRNAAVEVEKNVQLMDKKAPEEVDEFAKDTTN